MIANANVHRQSSRDLNLRRILRSRPSKRKRKRWYVPFKKPNKRTRRLQRQRLHRCKLVLRDIEDRFKSSKRCFLTTDGENPKRLPVSYGTLPVSLLAPPKNKLNPSHASHFGGTWKRQIGTIRRVLDVTLAKLGPRQLNHELLVTLIAEVSAVVNARRIGVLPTDPNHPQPLSFAMLLIMKT